ncbi:MAG: nitroreductase family protein [Acidimicrobiales bacterium]
MPTAFDLTQTDQLLSTTRAVRRRLDLTRPVERDLVLDCLRLAIQAPTGGNRQGWRWLVVDDAEKRAGLAGLYRRSFEPYIAERRAELPDDPVIRSSSHLSDHLHEVPVHVIPIGLGRLPDGASTVDTAGFYGSILPAVWSFQLALRSRGLGSVFTTLHLAYEDEAAELLGLPNTVTQMALIPVAYYTGTDFRPAGRRPIEEITYFNGWRQRA